MKDPVIAEDGHTYERKAIEDWFKTQKTSPLTGAPINDTKIISNNTLRSWIQAHQEYLEKKKSQPKEESLCFLQFRDLEKKWQENLAKKSGNQKVEEEWNRKTDSERLSWLEQLGLGTENYEFLQVEFKQFLSSSTQQQRYALTDDEGKYPSTEVFWKMLAYLQPEWLVAMHRAQKSSD